MAPPKFSRFTVEVSILSLFSSRINSLSTSSDIKISSSTSLCWNACLFVRVFIILFLPVLFSHLIVWRNIFKVHNLYNIGAKTQKRGDDNADSQWVCLGALLTFLSGFYKGFTFRIHFCSFEGSYSCLIFPFWRKHTNRLGWNIWE